MFHFHSSVRHVWSDSSEFESDSSDLYSGSSCCVTPQKEPVLNAVVRTNKSISFKENQQMDSFKESQQLYPSQQTNLNDDSTIDASHSFEEASTSTQESQGSRCTPEDSRSTSKDGLCMEVSANLQQSVNSGDVNIKCPNSVRLNIMHGVYKQNYDLRYKEAKMEDCDIILDIMRYEEAPIRCNKKVSSLDYNIKTKTNPLPNGVYPHHYNLVSSELSEPAIQATAREGVVNQNLANSHEGVVFQQSYEENQHSFQIGIHDDEELFQKESFTDPALDPLMKGIYKHKQNLKYRHARETSWQQQGIESIIDASMHCHVADAAIDGCGTPVDCSILQPPPPAGQQHMAPPVDTLAPPLEETVSHVGNNTVVNSDPVPTQQKRSTHPRSLSMSSSDGTDTSYYAKSSSSSSSLSEELHEKPLRYTEYTEYLSFPCGLQANQTANLSFPLGFPTGPLVNNGEVVINHGDLMNKDLLKNGSGNPFSENTLKNDAVNSNGTTSDSLLLKNHSFNTYPDHGNWNYYSWKPPMRYSPQASPETGSVIGLPLATPTDRNGVSPHYSPDSLLLPGGASPNSQLQNRLYNNAEDSVTPDLTEDLHDPNSRDSSPCRRKSSERAYSSGLNCPNGSHNSSRSHIQSCLRSSDRSQESQGSGAEYIDGCSYSDSYTDARQDNSLLSNISNTTPPLDGFNRVSSGSRQSDSLLSSHATPPLKTNLQPHKYIPPMAIPRLSIPARPDLQDSEFDQEEEEDEEEENGGSDQDEESRIGSISDSGKPQRNLNADGSGSEIGNIGSARNLDLSSASEEDESVSGVGNESSNRANQNHDSSSDISSMSESERLAPVRRLSQVSTTQRPVPKLESLSSLQSIPKLGIQQQHDSAKRKVVNNRDADLHPDDVCANGLGSLEGRKSMQNSLVR